MSGRASIGPLTLALDAATYRGSVALVRGADVLAEREVGMRGERADRLMPAVAEVLADGGVEVRDLERVVCGAGPGSFTSLRIAASIAKGIATSAGCPLYAVSSLLLVVAGARPAPAAGRYLAVLDAMRGEVFASLVEVGGSGRIAPVGDTELLPADAVESRAHALGAVAVGPGQPDGGVPHARGVARLPELLDAGAAVDLEAWEPDYGRLAEAQVRWEAAHGRALPGR